MAILLLGGNRFVGKRLAQLLLEEGRELTLLNRVASPYGIAKDWSMNTATLDGLEIRCRPVFRIPTESPRMSPKKIAQAWIAAFNQKDLEVLLALYSEHAVHLSPKLRDRQPQTQGLIQGQVALRGWWKDAFERLPTLHYELTSVTENESRVFIEYVRTVEGELPLKVAEVFELESGKIARSRVYHG